MHDIYDMNQLLANINIESCILIITSAVQYSLKVNI